MAEKTVLVDDIDGSTDGVETIRFTWNGASLRLDLNETHRAALNEALKPFLDVAQRDMRAPAVRRQQTTAAQRAAKERADIRSWAKNEGVDVPARGPIPEHVRSEYLARGGQS